MDKNLIALLYKNDKSIRAYAIWTIHKIMCQINLQSK